MTSVCLQTNGTPFDREQRENYTLVMSVEDRRDPPRVAHALLNVHVEDVNDNAPVFVKRPYYAIVSVDAVKGDPVKRVKKLSCSCTSKNSGDTTFS